MADERWSLLRRLLQRPPGFRGAFHPDCPRCGTSRAVVLDGGWNRLTCDQVAGGCGQPFYVHLELRPVLTVVAALPTLTQDEELR